MHDSFRVPALYRRVYLCDIGYKSCLVVHPHSADHERVIIDRVNDALLIVLRFTALRRLYAHYLISRFFQLIQRICNARMLERCGHYALSVVAVGFRYAEKHGVIALGRSGREVKLSVRGKPVKYRLLCFFKRFLGIHAHAMERGRIAEIVRHIVRYSFYNAVEGSCGGRIVKIYHFITRY